MAEWISVEERLPNEEEDVLVLVREVEHYGKHLEKRKVYRDVYVGWRVDGEWATLYCHGFNYLENEAEKYPNSDYKVTHWMPLPKLPVEAEQPESE